MLVGVAGFEPAAPCSQSRCATGLRYTPSTVRESAASISAAEKRAGGAGRDAAVADAVLHGGGDLAERRAERRKAEDRVVAEAARPPRRVGDDAFTRALDHAEAAVRIDDGNDAAVARGAALGRHAAQALQHQRVPAGLGAPGT